MKTIEFSNSAATLPIGKIFCLGRNYAEHAKEMKSDVPSTPIVFLKPSSAIIHNGEPIIRPSISKSLHHEAEVVVVIGKGGKNIPASEAGKHIAGYAIGLDMTLRDVQNDAKSKGLPWTVCKGFDTSAPISSVIPATRVADPAMLEFRCLVNGKQRQHGCASDMIFSPEEIIEYLSSLFTLEAGDLIFTGTPEGVGEVNPGDRVEAELIGFTKISHPVRTA